MLKRSAKGWKTKIGIKRDIRSSNSAEAFPGIPLHQEGDGFISEESDGKGGSRIVIRLPEPDDSPSDSPLNSSRSQPSVITEDAPDGPLTRSASTIHEYHTREKRDQLAKGSSMLNIINFFKGDPKGGGGAADPFPGIPLYAETKVVNPIFAKNHPLIHPASAVTSASTSSAVSATTSNSFSTPKKSASHIGNGTDGGPKRTISAPTATAPGTSSLPTQAQLPVRDPLAEDDALYEAFPAPPLKARVESGVASTIGKRPRMEDVHVVYDNFKEVFPDLLGKDTENDYSFYAIYDGHGGREAAEKVEIHLHKCIVEDPAFAEGRIEEAERNGYFKADEIMMEEAQVEGWGSGAVVVTAILIGNKLYIANAGDSEIILGRRLLSGSGHRSKVLSYKHRPTNPDEKARIEAEGGLVFRDRLYGTLAVSRALGDFEFKKPKSEGNFVSVEPALNTFSLKTVDEFVILACDGLWDKVSYEDAVNIVSAKRAEGLSATEIAQELVDEAVRRDSMDNVSAVVVFFNWTEKEAPPKLQSPPMIGLRQSPSPPPVSLVTSTSLPSVSSATSPPLPPPFTPLPESETPPPELPLPPIPSDTPAAATSPRAGEDNAAVGSAPLTSSPSPSPSPTPLPNSTPSTEPTEPKETTTTQSPRTTTTT